MSLLLEDFLPENISDETAFHLADFIMDLALALDTHYFVQTDRCCKTYSEKRQVASELAPDSDPF